MEDGNLGKISKPQHENLGKTGSKTNLSIIVA